MKRYMCDGVWVEEEPPLEEGEEFALPMEPLMEHDRNYRKRLYNQVFVPESEALMLVPKIPPKEPKKPKRERKETGVRRRYI